MYFAFELIWHVGATLAYSKQVLASIIVVKYSSLKRHIAGKMEGQNGCNNSVRKLSLNFGANVNIVSQTPGDSTNYHHVLPADRNVNQTNYPHLTEWTQTAKTSPAFVEFIAETSNFPRKASTKDVVAVVPSTVQTINGVSELRGEISYNHLTCSYSSKPTDSRVSQSVRIPTYTQKLWVSLC